MSFPDKGEPVPSAGSGSNIKFSDLRNAYNNGGGWETTPAAGNERLLKEEGIMSLGDFRQATFVEGDEPIPSGTNPISIGSHFCDKVFGDDEGGDDY